MSNMKIITFIFPSNCSWPNLLTLLLSMNLCVLRLNLIFWKIFVGKMRLTLFILTEGVRLLLNVRMDIKLWSLPLIKISTSIKLLSICCLRIRKMLCSHLILVVRKSGGNVLIGILLCWIVGVDMSRSMLRRVRKIARMTWLHGVRRWEK